MVEAAAAGMSESVDRNGWPERGTSNGNGRSWRARLARVLRYRLVIPIKRSIHSPEHTARGVAVGLALGLTPTIGIQMALVFVTWIATRRIFRWDFSLIIAMAWTWTTNVVTMFPCYYLFYVTGQIMLGGFDRVSGYDEFIVAWDRHVGDDEVIGYWEWLWSYTITLVQGWGVPMLIGCLPWAALGSWVGYAWSLRFVRRHRAARERRRAARHAARAARAAEQRP